MIAGVKLNVTEAEYIDKITKEKSWSKSNFLREAIRFYKEAHENVPNKEHTNMATGTNQ